MNRERFLVLVNDIPGQFVKLRWRRNQKTAAKFNHLVVEKETTAIVRTGIDYDRLASTIRGRKDGTLPRVNAGLQWGEWVTEPDDLFPFVLTHKGMDYGRIYAAKGQTPNVQWWLNGAPITAEVAHTFLTPSDAREEANRTSCHECFTVKMADLMEA